MRCSIVRCGALHCSRAAASRSPAHPRREQTLVPAVISARSRLRTEFDDVDMDGVPLALGEYPCDCLARTLPVLFTLFSTETTEITQSQGYRAAVRSNMGVTYEDRPSRRVYTPRDTHLRSRLHPRPLQA